MNFALLQTPEFLPEEVLLNIHRIAIEVLASQPKSELTQKLTAVHGYAQLVEGDPGNLAYHIALRRAAERLSAGMRAMKHGHAVWADRLDALLTGDSSFS